MRLAGLDLAILTKLELMKQIKRKSNFQSYLVGDRKVKVRQKTKIQPCDAETPTLSSSLPNLLRIDNINGTLLPGRWVETSSKKSSRYCDRYILMKFRVRHGDEDIVTFLLTRARRRIGHGVSNYDSIRCTGG